MHCGDFVYMRASINIFCRSDFGAYKSMHLLMYMLNSEEKTGEGIRFGNHTENQFLKRFFAYHFHRPLFYALLI